MKNDTVNECLSLFENFLTDKVDNHLKEYFKDELKGLERVKKNIAMSISQPKK